MCVITEEHRGTCDSPADRAALHNREECSIPCDWTETGIAQLDPAPGWEPNRIFLVARCLALLSLFAAPYPMPFCVCLLRLIFRALRAFSEEKDSACVQGKSDGEK